ncbi:TetR/AcrR family transcriptional regulator [Leucobacter albus]|uniref:TetR/AcrR family transcriptional regulator n=1 Tax=Leucobacter albus TaxID=272210 RepID=A0ABW3TLF6_9MICO
MAWDTEQTQRQLLDAGAVLFARHGFAGTTMDAVGRESGVNKERVYSYFGSKSGFFTAVLDDQLANLLEDLPIEGVGAAAVGTYALALFDRLQSQPGLARLLAWESLELTEPVAVDCRSLSCANLAAGLTVALPGVTQDAAEQLLLSVVTLVVGWWTLSRVADTILTVDTTPAARRAALRADAEALATARS